MLAATETNQRGAFVDKAVLRRVILSYMRATGAIDPLRLRFWDERGLTMPQLRLMHVLLRHGGQPVGHLAERLDVRPATVTGLTDRLFRNGLISRHPDPTDRRVVRIELTPDGERVLREVNAEGWDFLAQGFERMDEGDASQLATLLEEFLNQLVEARRAGAATGDVPANGA